MRDGHAPQVAQSQRLAVFFHDDHVFEIQRPVGHRVGEYLVLQTLAIESADRFQPMFAGQSVGDVGDRQVGGDKRGRLDFDDNLADIAPLDRHVGDVGDFGDPRSEVVIRVVVQLRRIAAPRHDERNDRKDRRRLPLDNCRRPRRKLRTDFRHAGPHVIERLHHVGAGGEIDRQLAGAADRFRPHADHAQHDADLLFDRSRDRDFDVFDAEAGSLGDDRNPRERHFGINAARHVEHGVNAHRAQQERREHQQPEVGTRRRDKIDAAVLGLRLVVSRRLRKHGRHSCSPPLAGSPALAVSVPLADSAAAAGAIVASVPSLTL